MSGYRIPAKFALGVKVIIRKNPSGLHGKQGTIVGLMGKYVEVGHFEGYSTSMTRLFLPKELEVMK